MGMVFNHKALTGTKLDLPLNMKVNQIVSVQKSVTILDTLMLRMKSRDTGISNRAPVYVSGPIK